MNLKKNGKVFTCKFVGTGPSSYEKRIYRAAVSQRLRNTALIYTRVTIYYSRESKDDRQVSTVDRTSNSHLNSVHNKKCSSTRTQMYTKTGIYSIRRVNTVGRRKRK